MKRLPDNCIDLNNNYGGYLATKCLLDNGHHDIGYIAGPLWKSDAQDRLKGHKKALAEFGIKFNDNLLFEGDFHEESGMNGLQYFLDNKIKITGLVCANDEMASGALGKARDEQISVPDDLSIIGYDDINVAYFLHPKLSTIRYPVEEMGKMAAKWVLKNAYKKEIDDIKTTFEPELITRNSCKKLTAI